MKNKLEILINGQTVDEFAKRLNHLEEIEEMYERLIRFIETNTKVSFEQIKNNIQKMELSKTENEEKLSDDDGKNVEGDLEDYMFFHHAGFDD